MSHSIIRLIYQERLDEWATAKGLRVEYQGASFEPGDVEAYLRAFLLPAGVNSNTLAGDHKAYTGLFQVSIVTPSGYGATAAESIADDLACLFPIYLRLSRGDFTVVVMTPVEPGPGITESERYTLSVSFQYRADTN